jgi:hypothetical protein
MKRRIAIIILSISLLFVTADALTTNWMILKQELWFSQGLLPNIPNLEINIIMTPLAGTVWLPIIKVGWVLLFIVLVSTVKNRRLL